MIAPALDDEPLNELRAVVGNNTAIGAYRAGTLPFPDGTVLVKLAWKRRQSPEFESATIPGATTTVQIMIKDSRKYAASGGWGSDDLSTASRWTKPRPNLLRLSRGPREGTRLRFHTLLAVADRQHSSPSKVE